MGQKRGRSRIIRTIRTLIRAAHLAYIQAEHVPQIVHAPVGIARLVVLEHRDLIVPGHVGHRNVPLQSERPADGLRVEVLEDPVERGSRHVLGVAQIPQVAYVTNEK